ncbi:hypothetical protein GPECTOR_96g736 [Gonium pectorale]|uniref:Pectate lyase domain-containing protein n=1 Tax=Gonium pectorale TaxID=33097 RepID=A0A150G1U5_GONPE|nr:hypothetical protein GPECTOR_96g736 [Gonium pectorale]|eukprot:KXZ43270.1 hypothetical protein GPECTOR_96g736 [Gonium pectorale]
MRLTPKGNFSKPEVTNWRDGSCPSRRQCRPRLLGVDRSVDVLIAGLELRDSAFWTLHVRESKRVRLHRLNISGDLDFPNNDGIDIDGSSYVTVTDTHVSTADDALCLKTTSAARPPTRHVLVSNVTLRSRSAAVKLGSESLADMYNITFRHLRVLDSNRGLAVQLRDYGSVRDVLFQHCHVETRRHEGGWWGGGEPLYVTALPRWVGSRVGVASNITFHHVTAEAAGGIVVLAGSPESSLVGIALHNRAQGLPWHQELVSLTVRGVECEGVMTQVRQERPDGADAKRF